MPTGTTKVQHPPTAESLRGPIRPHRIRQSGHQGGKHGFQRRQLPIAGADRRVDRPGQEALLRQSQGRHGGPLQVGAGQIGRAGGHRPNGGRHAAARSH